MRDDKDLLGFWLHTVVTEKSGSRADMENGTFCCSVDLNTEIPLAVKEAQIKIAFVVEGNGQVLAVEEPAEIGKFGVDELTGDFEMPKWGSDSVSTSGSVCFSSLRSANSSS